MKEYINIKLIYKYISHRIKVLFPHTSSAYGITYLNKLTRSSDWILNPMRYVSLHINIYLAAAIYKRIV